MEGIIKRLDVNTHSRLSTRGGLPGALIVLESTGPYPGSLY